MCGGGEDRRQDIKDLVTLEGKNQKIKNQKNQTRTKNKDQWQKEKMCLHRH